MTDQHPITPPPELVKQWWNEAQKSNDPDIACWLNYVATQAARWGSDQELEACLAEVSFFNTRSLADKIRITRRPKPPSLKEQALEALSSKHVAVPPVLAATIRRALEQLDD